MFGAAQADAASLRAANAALRCEVEEAAALRAANADLRSQIGELAQQRALAAVRSWPGLPIPALEPPC